MCPRLFLCMSTIFPGDTAIMQVKVVQTFQNKVLRSIEDSPCDMRLTTGLSSINTKLKYSKESGGVHSRSSSGDDINGQKAHTLKACEVIWRFSSFNKKEE